MPTDIQGICNNLISQSTVLVPKGQTSSAFGQIVYPETNRCRTRFDNLVHIIILSHRRGSAILYENLAQISQETVGE